MATSSPSSAPPLALPSWMSRTSIEVAPGVTELRTIVYPQVYTGLYSVPGINSWPWVANSDTEDGILVSIIGGPTGLTRIGVAAVTTVAQGGSPTAPAPSVSNSADSPATTVVASTLIPTSPSQSSVVPSAPISSSSPSPSSQSPSTLVPSSTALPASPSTSSTSRQPTSVDSSSDIPTSQSSAPSTSPSRSASESTTPITLPTFIPDSRGSISGGVIVAIVIGAAAVIALVLLLLGMCIHRRRKRLDYEAGHMSSGTNGDSPSGPFRSRGSSFMPISASTIPIGSKARHAQHDGRDEQEHLMGYRDDPSLPVTAGLAPASAMTLGSRQPSGATHTSSTQTDSRNSRFSHGAAFRSDKKPPDDPDAGPGAGPMMQQPRANDNGSGSGATERDGSSRRDRDSLFYTSPRATPSDRRTIPLTNPLIGLGRPGEFQPTGTYANAEAGPSRPRGVSLATSTSSKLSNGLARMFGSGSSRDRSASHAGASFLDNSNESGESRELTVENLTQAHPLPHLRRDTLDTGTVISNVPTEQGYESGESRNSRLARNVALMNAAGALSTLREATTRDEESTTIPHTSPILRDNPNYRRVTTTAASWTNEDLADLARRKSEAVRHGHAPLSDDEQDEDAVEDDEESRKPLQPGTIASDAGGSDGTLRVIPAAAARSDNGKRWTSTSLGQPVRRMSGLSAMSILEAVSSVSQSLHTARSQNSSKSRSSRSAGSRDESDISRANSKRSTAPLSIKKKQQRSEGASSGSESRRSRRSQVSSGDEMHSRRLPGALPREVEWLAPEDTSKRSMNGLPNEAPGSWLTGEGLPPLPISRKE